MVIPVSRLSCHYSSPRAEPGWETWPGSSTEPRMASHGYGAALWLSWDPAAGAGTAGSAPRAGQKPPVLFLTAFPPGAGPGQGLQSPRHPGPVLGNCLVPTTSRILFLELPVVLSCFYRGVPGQTGGWQPASLAPECPLPLWHTWCVTVSTPALICLTFSSEIFPLSWQHSVCSTCAASSSCSVPSLGCTAPTSPSSGHSFLGTAAEKFWEVTVLPDHHLWCPKGRQNETESKLIFNFSWWQHSHFSQQGTESLGTHLSLSIQKFSIQAIF